GGLGGGGLGSLGADSAARPGGHLGRRAGTTAVAEAPSRLETGPACERSAASRDGHPLMILDPIDPYGRGRWDRGFVTKEALCRADPDVRAPPYPHRLPDPLPAGQGADGADL